ncbi:MAG TPA: cytochrome c maturation protein CcmE [Acidimicrobiales bacterium]|jgi:cytochrome c-type biogenesis protein CcmE|nr:cytochrome c maturation protein CcmE [Acidimicrobiales bacterium]
MTTAPVVTGPPPSAPATTTPRRPSHRLRYATVGVVLIGAFAFLLVKGLSSAINFYLPVDQALHQKSTLGSQTFNLEGLVMPGSIQSTTRGVDFTLTAGGDSVRVVNTSSPPQLFQNNIPVIAVGHWSGGTFLSNQILVKHSANYIAANPGRVTAPNGSKR